MDFFELRMKELIAQLAQHNVDYYTLDAPTVSDAEYDALYDELLQLEKSTGKVLENSPTKRVGGEILRGFAEYTHRARLYSLDKCKSFEQVEEWYQKVCKEAGFEPAVTVEYKYDGLTINLTYENGFLTRAATRGDGITGEDVTEQVRTIRNVPKEIPYKGVCEVQGEGVMRLSVLKEYNEQTDNVPLKNARNAVAGGIRNQDPTVTANRKLDVVAYNVGYMDSDLTHLRTQSDMHGFIVQNGLYGGDFFEVCDNLTKVKELVDKAAAERDTLDILIDGMVIKVDSLDLREKLGYTEKFPKWAMAYKFKPQEVTTVLREVCWQVSRTGKLNPLAVLDPADIGGVTVSRATLSNLSEIQRKKIKIGSRVLLRRSNDVIPEITGVTEYLPDAKDVAAPTVCPVCGSPVVQDGVFLYCTNRESCAQQIISKLTHYCSKGAMDIDGFSEKTIEKLFLSRGLNSFEGIYKLTKEDLAEVEGFKEKRTLNLLASIEKSKQTGLASFLYALGIANIGKKSATQLANAFGSIDKLKVATAEQLTALDDFGEIMASGVVEYFSDADNLIQIDALLAVLTFTEQQNKGTLKGERIVVTGKLARFKRSEIEQSITENGGEVQASVGKSTTILIAGEDAGSKLEKAQKLGIRIISEEDYLALIAVNG